MKKLGILITIVLVVIAGNALIKYLPLLAPVISAQGKTGAQIAQEQAQLNKDLVASLEKDGVVDPALINALTASVEDTNLADGEDSDTQPVENTSRPAPLADASSANQPFKAIEERDIIINTSLKQIEKFKKEYSLEIKALIHTAKAEYHDLPPEQKNANAITTIGFKYADRALAMEGSADERYKNILSELEKALISAGSSTDVVNEMQDYYESFKEVQKQNYIAEIIAASKK